MKKSYLVGGLAIVGAIALFAYLKPKPKRNSDGFFSANGRASKMVAPRGNCAWCQNSDGGLYHTGANRTCGRGDACVNKYAFN